MSLSVSIHLFVVGLIIARSYILEPLFIIEIPLYCFFDAFFELERWFPSEFCLKLARVDGVTGIMTEAVSDVSDEVEVFAFLTTEESVNSIDHNLDDVDVLLLVEASDVVCFCHLALMDDNMESEDCTWWTQRRSPLRMPRAEPQMMPW